MWLVWIVKIVANQNQTRTRVHVNWLQQHRNQLQSNPSEVPWNNNHNSNDWTPPQVTHNIYRDGIHKECKDGLKDIETWGQASTGVSSYTTIWLAHASWCQWQVHEEAIPLCIMRLDLALTCVLWESCFLYKGTSQVRVFWTYYNLTFILFTIHNLPLALGAFHISNHIMEL